METQIPWFSNESLEIRPNNWETKSELMVKNPMVSGFDVPLKHPNDVFFLPRIFRVPSELRSPTPIDGPWGIFQPR
jgi:hypothetical protein